jgi:hypothetical protein
MVPRLVWQNDVCTCWKGHLPGITIHLNPKEPTMPSTGRRSLPMTPYMSTWAQRRAHLAGVTRMGARR